MIIKRRIDEVCTLCGTSSEVIIHFIEEEWIIPVDKSNYTFDEEDVARIKLIIELKNEFGVNDEAIPIILHLVDQLNVYRLGREQSH